MRTFRAIKKGGQERKEKALGRLKMNGDSNIQRIRECS